MRQLSLNLVACTAAIALLGCGVPLTTAPPPPASSETRSGTDAIGAAFAALDLAATAADTVLLLKPSFAGTPAAVRLADALAETRTWLKRARAAERLRDTAGSIDALRKAAAAMQTGQALLFAIAGGK